MSDQRFEALAAWGQSLAVKNTHVEEQMRNMEMTELVTEEEDEQAPAECECEPVELSDGWVMPGCFQTPPGEPARYWCYVRDKKACEQKALPVPLQEHGGRYWTTSLCESAEADPQDPSVKLPKCDCEGSEQKVSCVEMRGDGLNCEFARHDVGDATGAMTTCHVGKSNACSYAWQASEVGPNNIYGCDPQMRAGEGPNGCFVTFWHKDAQFGLNQKEALELAQLSCLQRKWILLGCWLVCVVLWILLPLLTGEFVKKQCVDTVSMEEEFSEAAVKQVDEDWALFDEDEGFFTDSSASLPSIRGSTSRSASD